MGNGVRRRGWEGGSDLAAVIRHEIVDEAAMTVSDPRDLKEYTGAAGRLTDGKAEALSDEVAAGRSSKSFDLHTSKRRESIVPGWLQVRCALVGYR